MGKHYANITLNPGLGYNQMILGCIFSHRIQFLSIIIVSIFGIIFSIISPLILRSIIDDVLIGGHHQNLLLLLIILSLLFIFSCIANYFSYIIKGRYEIVLFNDISMKIFDAIQHAPLKNIQKIKIGDLQSRTIANVNPVVQIVSTTIPQTFISFFSIVIPFIIMFSLNQNLTLIISSPIVLFILSSWYFGNTMKKTQKPILNSSATLSSFLKESFSILSLIKVYNLEDWITKKYKEKLFEFNNASFLNYKITALNSSVTLLLYSIPTIFILSFGSIAVMDGSMSIGTLTAFMAYIGQFFSPINQVSFFWTNYKSSQASYDRIREIISFNDDHYGMLSLPEKPKKIEFDKVWFSYESRIILKNYCATFKQGCNYLIGDNGSGKTTLVSLMARLYSPDKGSILIDGQDLKLISKQSIIRSISIVFSDSLIFDGTIAENIAIGKLNASEEAIISAAQKAELHEFVMTLQNKYKTQVGESGLNLSSGEKQKIALARVILRDTPIIIFDEFTRSIDDSSKEQIFSVLNKMEEKIIIIITHDLKDIKGDCNVIHIKNLNS